MAESRLLKDPAVAYIRYEWPLNRDIVVAADSVPARPVDALTCCGTCRTRKSRGGDLAYLTALPPDQARARRMLHDAIDSDIFIARMASASQREGRQERRGLPRVRRMKTART